MHMTCRTEVCGGLAGSCRAEGAPETPQALGDAGRTNLTVHLYDHADHDLNWTLERARTGGPPAFHEAFDVMARLVGR